MRSLSVVLFSLAVSCSAPPCGPGTCFGCCDPAGACAPSGAATCGENGATCSACRVDEVCAAGQCVNRSQAGGGAAGGRALAGGSSGGSIGGGNTSGGVAGGQSGGFTFGGGTAGGFTAGGAAGGIAGGTAGGMATCRPPTQQCAGLCRDFSTDPQHCGQCNRSCGLGNTCVGGLCRPVTCMPGSFCSLSDGGFGSCCDGTCRNTSADPLACGACGLSCPSPLCSTGACVSRCGADGGVCGPGTECVSRSGTRACAITACTAATENSTCSLGGERAGRCCGGACVDLASPTSCGGCGIRCTGGTECLAGSCRASANCATAEAGSVCSLDGGSGTCCNSECLGNITSSNDHCGACGRVCPATTTCVSGSCVTDAGTFLDCSQSCPGGTSCRQGHCVTSTCVGASLGQACGPFSNGACCGAGCADLWTSSQHCGACGRACTAGQFCSQGSCQARPTCTPAMDGRSCPIDAGLNGICCSGSCVDSTSRSDHCGSCNLDCGTDGRCTPQGCRQGDGGFPSCATTTCPPGTVCHLNGVCMPVACPAGSSGGVCSFGKTSNGGQGQCCQGRCLDLAQDPANCRACGTACPPGSLCVAPFLPSGAFCLPAAPSSNCLLSCAPGTFCVDRRCEPTTCGSGPPGAMCLTGGNVGACCNFLSPTCANLRTDPNNCGACGALCTGGVCIDGVCQRGGATCQLGEVGRYCRLDAGTSSICCPGSGCVDTAVDNLNCGGCGPAFQCGAGLQCMSGRCVAPTCTSATAGRPCTKDGGVAGSCCGTSCAQLSTDPLSCGSCGRQCAQGETCSQGRCALAVCDAFAQGAPCHLDAGVGTCCGSSCVSTQADPVNCGFCNRQCQADAGCVSGMCR